MNNAWTLPLDSYIRGGYITVRSEDRRPCQMTISSVKT